MAQYVQCTACGEVVGATEPCSCVFDVNGTLDAQGVLHTAPRVAWVEEEYECECGECGNISSAYECPCCGTPLF